MTLPEQDIIHKIPDSVMPVFRTAPHDTRRRLKCSFLSAPGRGDFGGVGEWIGLFSSSVWMSFCSIRACGYSCFASALKLGLTPVLEGSGADGADPDRSA